MNLSSEVSAMFNSLMPSLNSRSLPFVVFLGGFPSRCQNLSSGAIRPGGLLFPLVPTFHYFFQLFATLPHFSHFSHILVSSIEVLPKCIASCSSSEIIIVLFSNFNLVIDFKGYFHNIESPIWTFVISRGAEGPGREILQRPPSVRLSVCPSVPSRLVFAL